MPAYETGLDAADLWVWQSRIFAQPKLSLDAIGVTDANLNVIEFLNGRSRIKRLTFDEDPERSVE